MRSARITLMTVALLGIAAAPVQAYTDPGSGSLILQLLFAALFGVLFYVRAIALWVRRFFFKRRAGAPRRRPSTADDSNPGPLSR